MSMLSKLLFGSNPAGAAKPYLDQIPGVAHQGYDPYVNEGRDASGRTKTAYEGLMDDPSGFINKIMENYKTSEGYNFQKGQLTKELGNTAAAGGVAGTPQDQLNQGQAIQGLLSKDMQTYLQNVLGRYDKGLEGEEGIATRGYDASGKLTDTLGGALNQQGGLAFQGQSQDNQNKSQFFQSLMQALGGGLAFGSQPTGSIFGHKLWGK